MFNIKFANASLDDLVQLLCDSGYEVEKHELEFAREHDLFGFVGTNLETKTASYLFGCEHPEFEGHAVVGRVIIQIGHGGLVADYAGVPDFEGPIEEATKFVANTKI